MKDESDCDPDLAAADAMLHRTLVELAPASVIVVGDGEPAGLGAWRRDHPDIEVAALPVSVSRHADSQLPAKRYAVGVIAGMRTLSPAQARALIALLRDRYCDAIVVVAPVKYWAVSDWLALGFELRDRCTEDADEVGLYRYDVADANPERDWNNARDWAHPENFHRYRW